MNRREFLRGLGHEAGDMALYTGLGAALYHARSIGKSIVDAGYEELRHSTRSEELTQRLDGLNKKLRYKSGNRIAMETQDKRFRELMEKERTEPGSVKPGYGTVIGDFARLLFGEAREYYEHEEYPGWVGDVVLTRYERSGATLKSVIFDRVIVKDANGKKKVLGHQFNCFNEWDPNYPFIIDPLRDSMKHPEDRVSWESLYGFAEAKLKQGPGHAVTHYWVHPTARKPYWAKGREPLKTIKLNGKTSRFYDLGDYRTSIVVSHA